MSHSPESNGGDDVLSFSDLTFEEIVAAVMMLIIVGSVAWGVTTRYLLASPADWAPEVASIAFAWTIFIAAAAAFLRRDHSSVNALINKFPPRMCSALQGLADAIVMATLVAVAWLAASFAIATLDVPTTVLQIPQTVTYSAAAFGFALMAIRHGMSVMRRLAAVRARP